MHPDDRAADAKQMGDLLSGATATARYEVRYQTDNGQTLWFQVHARPVHDLAGNLSGLTGTLTDLTDRKRLEHQLVAQAFTDPLTGLANRTLLRERTERSLGRRI